jgi:parvulin-like peptidyl-prolyl isomerase
MKNLVAGTTLALSLLAAGCASNSYLAEVNDRKITGPELKDEFVKRHGGHTKFLLGVSETRQFLDVVIDQDLLIQEAYRLELENTPDIKTLVADYEDRKSTEYFLKVEIQDKAKPTPEQVKAAWEKETTKLYQTRQIVLDTRAEAEAVYLQFLFGADFDLLARICSIAPSRIHGGLLPPIGWGSKSPEFEAAVFPLDPGEASPPFETPDGWEIVELTSVDLVDKPDFDKATQRIQTILEKRMLEERRNAISDYLWGKYHARIADVELTPTGLRDALKANPNAAIATWDGGELSVKDFLSAVDWSAFPNDLPGRFRFEIEKQLRQTVNAPLVLKEAKARGLEKAPEVADAVRRYQEDLMERSLYADYVFRGLTVTDAEAKAYYEQHKTDFMAPEKRRVSHIVVATKAEAEAIAAEIAGGESFAKLVSHSTDTDSAKKVGDLGWISRPEAVGELAAVFTLEEGKVSVPIESKYGYHLFLVTKVVPEQPLDYAEAKPRVEKRVLEQKEREKRKLWIQRLRDSSKIEINNAAIQAFVKANTAS